ncbi:MAG: HAMP domain-containing sensor histidine kinase [Pseudomonadota bacterium]
MDYMISIYFFYGLSFIILGVSVFIYPKDNSYFKISKHFWLIGLFGILQGFNEWIDLLIYLDFEPHILDLNYLGLFIGLISFVPLLQFGISLIVEWYEVNGFIVKFMPMLIFLVCLLVIGVIGFDYNGGQILGRYSIGLPGSIFTSIALLMFARQYDKKTLFNIKNDFHVASFLFALYAIFAGLITPVGNFFPSNIFNNEIFFDIFGFDVHVFRALIAFGLSICIVRSLRIFDLENKEKLKNLNKMILEKNEKLSQFDKLKSAFVANVSHEFKNPLAIIKSNVEFLEELLAPKMDNDQKELFASSIKVTNRLTRLVNDLLDLSKIESGKMEIKKEIIDLKEMLNEVIASFKLISAKKNIEIATNIDNNIGVIIGDRDRLIEVLSNILNNSVKYSPENTRVEISVEGCEKLCKFSIKDQGPGIPVEYRAKIFDKFERIKSEKQEGTGLGLPIAKDIVELHKGRIWIEDTNDQSGSKFVFEIPRTILNR